jgi:hypothetical protein
MELKLNIGSYCSLVWSLFRDHCNYYKELLKLKLYQILDQEECFTIWEAYTKEFVDGGRSFFGRNPVAMDFALGAQFYFSTSFLEGITDAVGNALIIQWAMFPREWLSPAAPEATYSAPLTPAPPPPTTNTVAGTCPGAEPPCPGIGKEAGHTPSKTTWAYGSIPTVVQQCLQSVGNTHIVWKADDGPPNPSAILPSTGNSFICWNSVLAKCYQGPRCRFAQGHVQKGEATDAFAGAFSDVIKKEVAYYTDLLARSGSPSGNQEAGGGVQNP